MKKEKLLATYEKDGLFVRGNLLGEELSLSMEPSAFPYRDRRFTGIVTIREKQRSGSVYDIPVLEEEIFHQLCANLK